VHDTLADTHYDLVHCEWSPYAIHLRGCTRPVVISAHNVEAQVWRRLAEASRGTPQGLVYRVQADRMANFERWAFGNAAFATAVSEPDALALGELGARDVTVVPNGVDLEFFRPPPGDGPEDLVVFTGSMDWRPNQDGIRWYLDEVHPLLRGRVEAPLVVVGRNPPSWLSEDHLPPDVEVTGSVPDVRPYLERAGVFVVPLRAGGGSRLKILEALAAGRAVVSTTVGAEGLDLEDGKHLVLADTPEIFAAAVEGLLGDRDRARALGLAGRKRVEDRYGWDAIAEIQAGVWRRAAASGT
jgi:glycosyltransferase involved in cell wall biosynthesis